MYMYRNFFLCIAFIIKINIFIHTFITIRAFNFFVGKILLLFKTALINILIVIHYVMWKGLLILIKKYHQTLKHHGALWHLSARCFAFVATFTIWSARICSNSSMVWHPQQLSKSKKLSYLYILHLFGECETESKSKWSAKSTASWDLPVKSSHVLHKRQTVPQTVLLGVLDEVEILLK